MLSVAPNVPENWFNLSSMLNLLDMESLEDATGDLKIYNLLVGKSSGQPKFGCPYCDSGKPFNLEPYNLLDLKLSRSSTRITRIREIEGSSHTFRIL